MCAFFIYRYIALKIKMIVLVSRLTNRFFCDIANYPFKDADPVISLCDASTPHSNTRTIRHEGIRMAELQWVLAMKDLEHKEKEEQLRIGQELLEEDRARQGHNRHA
jgi:hypothetical protein